MKILVAVKRVIDYNVQIRVKEDGSGVVTDNVKMSTNPPDDNAIEEAVKIKESGKATEVIAVTVGEEKAQETVRKALAVGADRGILIKTDGIVEPLAVAKVLQKTVRKYDIPSRFGGEEFFVLLPETNIAKAKKVAERLRLSLPKNTLLKKYNVQISLGVTEYKKLDTQKRMINRADKALYISKKNGRNQTNIL